MSKRGNNKSPAPSGMFNGVAILILALIVFFIWSFFVDQSLPNDQKYSTILSYFNDGKVDEYVLDLGTGELVLYMKEGESKESEEAGLEDYVKDGIKAVARVRLSTEEMIRASVTAAIRESSLVPEGTEEEFPGKLKGEVPPPEQQSTADTETSVREESALAPLEAEEQSAVAESEEETLAEETAILVQKTAKRRNSPPKPKEPKATEESSSQTEESSIIIAGTEQSGSSTKERAPTVFDTLFGWGSSSVSKQVDTREKIIYQVPNTRLFLENIDEVVKEYNAANPNARVKYNWIPAKEPSLLSQLLPQLIIMAIVILPIFLMMRNMGGLGGGGSSGKMGMFGGKTKGIHRVEQTDVTFDDVAGADEEKAELKEVVDFLKNPSKYNALGARIPKGVLLVGPPGTGKTLLAKAVAGEANVPFFSLAGSDFVEMFVGLGASRVRELFEEAKKESPSIIFIDEIDAVGRQRSAGVSGGQDEREQTLNQLLVEMDGFKTDETVIVISATNRADILDKALLRPGRFDRQVTVNKPDIKGREDILKVHVRKKPLAPDVDLRVVAQTTVGFTGADLENLTNEAALLAAKNGKKAITMSDFQNSLMKVVMGLEKAAKVVSEKEKRSTCYHEAGHAVASYYLESLDPVHEVSIIPRGMAGGYTMSLPTEDKNYRFRGEMAEDLVMTLGGLTAEKIIYGDTTTGVSGDLRHVDQVARAMVLHYGFSKELGTVSYDDDPGGYPGVKFSEKTKSLIDDEVRKLADEAAKRCEEILTTHIDKLHKVAKYLFRFEKIDGDTFRKLMEEDGDYDGILVREDGSFAIVDTLQEGGEDMKAQKFSEEVETALENFSNTIEPTMEEDSEE